MDFTSAPSSGIERVHNPDGARNLQNSTEERIKRFEKDAMQRLLLEDVESPSTDDDVPMLNIHQKEVTEESKCQDEKTEETTEPCRVSNLDRAKQEFFNTRPSDKSVKIIMAKHSVTRETQTMSMTKLIEAKYAEDNGLSPKYIPIFDFAIIMVVFNIVVPFCGLVVFLRAMF